MLLSIGNNLIIRVIHTYVLDLNGHMIKDGDNVIIKMHDEGVQMLKVTNRTDQKIGRTNCSVKALIGAPCGSVFEIDGRKLRKVEDENLFEISFEESEAGSGDNRSYIDNNTAQKMTDDDIHRMREAGVSGVNIIKSLIENSETWKNKTEFAQAKWLIRKQKKYVRRFRVLKCTPQLLCDAYHRKNNNKICNMRWDSLALLLSRAGICSGCRVLVIESVMGLVVGSIAYRMRGQGQIMAMYGGTQQPHNDLVDRLNLTTDDLSVIHTIPVSELRAAANDVREFGLVPAAIESIVGSAVIVDVCAKPKLPTLPHNSSGRHPADLLKGRALLRQGFNSLVIACRFHVLPVLSEALSLLSPSSGFAIFSEFQEPLAECFEYLQTRQLAIGLSLSDCWLREFQTLAGRCHPKMNMPTSGGFVLSGIYAGGRAAGPSNGDENNRKRSRVDAHASESIK